MGAKLLPSASTLAPVEQNRQLVAARLPGLVDQHDQRRGQWRLIQET
jgi:hypothetical protein